MNLETLYHWFARLFFFTALAILAVIVVELVLNAFHYTVLRGAYTKGRLAELSAMLLVFVIVILLRQIRDELRTRRLT